MKLYFAIIDEFGNANSRVVTGEPMDLLRHAFISLPSGEFNLEKPAIADRVEEIRQLFATTFAGLETPVEVIKQISKTLTHKPVAAEAVEVAEELAETLMIFNLADDNSDLVDFLDDLRCIFDGTEYDLTAMTDNQTTLIVRVEM